ncbi:hypothetical protein OCL06_12230 [Alteromonas sp. ASW11-19]|uniref:Tetratricopeptide repeat protein n=1 Tax=Alteromonas salexigens TaxID=2982530 RepID=A0ABT2VPW8_9ALTE|nr:hypothetical protein [Alteromonas salexigens]MCU7555355.1 hypothetical protein [Alteromonas salexigens]
MAKLRQHSLILSIVTAIILPVAAHAADGPALKLKTSIEDVNGVREIEAGEYVAGIRKTLAALNMSSAPSRRAPLLNNLCVAHIATGNLSTAQQSCNDAVASAAGSAIAYNNRAVYYCLADRADACHADLEKAQQLSKEHRLIRQNLNAVADSDLLVSSQ